MHRKIGILIFLISLSYAIEAQQVRPSASAEIHHELLQLNKLVKVLYFAAHPDDENTRLLSWLVNDQNINTAYLSLTRGDGGQNIIGREQGPALGLIRTYELLEARKIDGAGQFFTRAVDFGFSKNTTETFKHWNENILTGDAVWTIRRFRPDVIICRFPPDARAGHGQHAASAVIAEKAFKAAGDKGQFSEQLKYLQTWQPKRILLNSYRFGNNNTTSESQLKIATGQYKPQMGMGYGELAGISRSVHKSQGAGTPSVAGIQTEYFALVDGQPLSASLFDGIDVSWNRVGRKDIGDQINDIIQKFDYNRPDLSLPHLLKLRKQIAQVKDNFWRKEKLAELDKIILDCSGFMAELFCGQPEAVAGSSLPFTLNVIARSTTPVRLKELKWTGAAAKLNARLGNDSLFSLKQQIDIPAGTPLTEPYWLTMPGEDADHYYLPSDTLNGLPESPSRTRALLSCMIGEESFDINVPLSYKRLDPVKGDVTEALRIVPAVMPGFTHQLLISNDDGSLNTEVRLHPLKDITSASLSIELGQPLLTISHLNLKAGIDTVLPVKIPKNSLMQTGTKEFILKAVLNDGDNRYDKTQQLIAYDHIPTLQYFTPAETRVLNKNWKSTVSKIAYIEGAGDYTADFLRLAGLSVTILKDEDFTSAANLKQYDAIITGVRAVNTEKRMNYWLPVLHQYVQNGGTLVVQYNTVQGLTSDNIGPYPFSLGNARVTEENAEVNFLNPSHRLLNYPNKITKNDFKGWVQERGLYFPVTWDNHYEPLFEMNDTGEAPLKGCTLYTTYGKGHFIYSSLSFFRQLPAGNTGAVRLLMNMLSVGK